MSITVFLADDHGVIRDGLRMLLQSQLDLDVIGEAENGRDAVRLVTKLRPDVAILDIAMPELNGLEAARQIRELCPTTQVIMLSMYGTADHVLEALEMGVRGYLLKASAGAQVVDAVRAVHRGQRYLSQRIVDTVIDASVEQRQHAGDEAKSPLARLSRREREVLQLVAEGKTSVEVAEILSLSPKTVDTYRSNIMRKLEIDDLAGLIRFSIRQGLTSLD